jgi:hypothetical protein
MRCAHASMRTHTQVNEVRTWVNEEHTQVNEVHKQGVRWHAM